MPIYEYRCTSCEKVIEVIQRMGERPLSRCRSCRGRLEKLVSRTSFRLRGGGWYSEGYAKDGAKTRKNKNKNKNKNKKTSSPSPSKPDPARAPAGSAGATPRIP